MVKLIFHATLGLLFVWYQCCTLSPVSGFQNDLWTRYESGYRCYFNESRTDCANCYSGGCPCSGNEPHRCVRCKQGADCSKPPPVGPLNTIGILHGSIHLQCPCMSNNVWTRWNAAGPITTLFAGGRVAANFVDRMRSSNCDLHVDKLQYSDAGFYACSFGNSTETIRRTVVVAVLAREPDLNANVSLDDVVEDDVVQFSCSLSFSSPVNVTMTLFNNASQSIRSQREQRVNPDDTNVRILTSSTVFVAKRRSSAGPAKCRVSVTVAPANDTYIVNQVYYDLPIRIVVKYPVTNIQLKSEPSDRAGQQRLRCTADGYPAPTYEWRNHPHPNQTDTYAILCLASNTIRGRTYTIPESYNDEQTTATHTTGSTESGYTALCVLFSLSLVVIVLLTAVLIRQHRSLKDLASRRYSSTHEHRYQSLHKSAPSTGAQKNPADPVYDSVELSPPFVGGSSTGNTLGFYANVRR